MKHIYWLALVLLFSCQKDTKSDKNFHLTGNIEGLKQGTLYIKKVQDTALVIIDSIVLKGKSTFDTYFDLDSPQMLYLQLDRGSSESIDNMLEFFAEPGTMDITTSLKQFYAAATIKGSKNQELYEDFMEMKSKFNDENLNLIQARIENETKKLKKVSDSIETKYAELLKRKYLYTANYALTHADNEIAPFLALSEISNANIHLLDTIAKSMSAKVKESVYGKKLTEFITQRKKTEQKP